MAWGEYDKGLTRAKRINEPQDFQGLPAELAAKLRVRKHPFGGGRPSPGWAVRTREGTMEAEWGDWLALDSGGEPYPIAAGIFAAAYQPTGAGVRRGVLWRLEDPSGVSGTGIVALWAAFPRGRVVVEWCEPPYSLSVHDGMAAAVAVHGHGGRTVFAPPPMPTPDSVYDGRDAGDACARRCGAQIEGGYRGPDGVHRCGECADRAGLLRMHYTLAQPPTGA